MSQQAVGGEVVVERVEADTAGRTQEVGRRLGERLRAADLVILSGELGAGKTTFTQGLAEGLGVRGPITSPTFVIARVHPSLSGGVPLVHVDAYRLGSLAELDDLDLDASVEDSVTVVEWGEGKAEVLSGQRLEVRIERAVADDVPLADGDETPLDPRVITVIAHGDALAARLA
ncbi:MAG: tRNA (adenosine(37)-N6)-threonylcarbamoyltransferase complex ATPase subunit type 1 TsaE [Actinocrinis sp.]